MYVYQPTPTAAGKFLVGFYVPSAGNFVVESEQNSAADAADRVRYLNGGALPE